MWAARVPVGIRAARRLCGGRLGVGVPPAGSAGGDSDFYRPEDIALAIEIVSPESVERDHEVKPRKYARAGIKNLWLIERDGEGMIAYVYTIDPLTGNYSLIGTFTEQLKVSVPFDIAIDFGTLEDYR